jgi:hypothetical protein
MVEPPYSLDAISDIIQLLAECVNLFIKPFLTIAKGLKNKIEESQLITGKKGLVGE